MKNLYKSYTAIAILISTQALANEKISSITDPIEINRYDYIPNKAYSSELTNALSISEILNQYTKATDGFYNNVISPAKSLDQLKTDFDRVSEANDKIQNNLSAVMDAFDNAPEEEKGAAVERALKMLDPNFEKGQIGRIEFTDGEISGAFSRIGFVIEKQTARAEQVLAIFTSYKRSAKPSDYVFEYENYQDITRGNITTRTGSDTSWLPEEAAPAMQIGETLVVKKCRQILGWKCGTTLYRTDQKEDFKYVYMGNYDLAKNPDNAFFRNDGRTKNQIAGSTALFVVKESEKHILFAAADSTWNKKGLQFSSIIQNEYQKDLSKFKQRLFIELGRKNK